MKKVKAVIGANWGDEGKGLMTDYFCHEAISRGETCVTVCTNGGAQRGHTVTIPDGKSHVFHHFGSGTLAGAVTYLPREYILNPMTFCKEYLDFGELKANPIVFANPDCLWSTPYDMMINQILEELRGDKRHGSCGMGIWETIVRNSNETQLEFRALRTLQDLARADRETIRIFLDMIRNEYLPYRLKMEGYYLPDHWKSIVYSEGLLKHFEEDLQYMLARIGLRDEELLTHFNTVVFENGQGLMLDERYGSNIDNTTPSNTGVENIFVSSETLFEDRDIEICYVSRTYSTRHGEGALDFECGKKEVNPYMSDQTNLANQFQGALRFGELNYADLIGRITSDFESCNKTHNDWKMSVAMTHTNEVTIRNELELRNSVDYLYESSGKTRETISSFVSK